MRPMKHLLFVFLSLFLASPTTAQKEPAPVATASSAPEVIVANIVRTANKLGYVSKWTCASRMRHGGKRTSRQTSRYWFIQVPGSAPRKLDGDHR